MQKEEQKPVNEIVISDTCCLISFEKINKLYLLNDLYRNVYITYDVLNEYERGGSKIPVFIKVKEVKNKDEINKYLSIGLHLGEASSIALYNECKNPLLLTDDTRAREYAMINKLNYSTTLDILLEGREAGYIKTNKELHNALDDLGTTKRWMPKEIIDEIKKKYIVNEQKIINNNKIDNLIENDEKIKKLIAREIAVNNTLSNMPKAQQIATKLIENLHGSSNLEIQKFWPEFWKEVPIFISGLLDKIKKNINSEKLNINNNNKNINENKVNSRK